ncbi:MAG: hypothetical protein BWY88_00740 [Synergistetes bacterium ADurb.Bin520]|nr:MAG: hypothetical protein BWY88_00740 [Synergistetes bacterium ADurb.Bin520]
MGTPRSAALFKMSPASTPSPPEYVGIWGLMPISMEKYATVRKTGSFSTMRRSDCPTFLPCTITDMDGPPSQNFFPKSGAPEAAPSLRALAF